MKIIQLLIDFGVGWFRVAVTIAEGLHPPGTPVYRALRRATAAVRPIP